MYWIVFAIFTTAEIFVDTIIGFWLVLIKCRLEIKEIKMRFLWYNMFFYMFLTIFKQFLT